MNAPVEKLGDDEKTTQALDTLVSLLVGVPRESLTDAVHHIKDEKQYEKDLAAALPSVIATLREQDSDLRRALQPIIAEVLQELVVTQPELLADTLSPIMMPAIKKAISNALESAVARLDQVVQHTFTPQGISWRIEAMRTGRSFAEVVLLRTLQYRVEQVFCIHAATGTLLTHAARDESEDADLVSAMLTAIQDFVKDSFRADADMDSIKFGNLTLMLHRTKHTIIATAVRGAVVDEVRSQAEEIGALFERNGELLSNFNGDTGAFDKLLPDVSACLTESFLTPEKKSGSKLPLIAIACILIAATLWWFFKS